MDPPATSPRVTVFDLMVELLDAPEDKEGSFRKLMVDITHGIQNRAMEESKHPGLSMTQHPNEVEGKTVLPRCDECFVVRVTNRHRQRVGFLFQWRDLYNSAFHVEDDNPCWYIYKDFFKKIALPPSDQFNYVPRLNQGFHVLNIEGNYDKLGTKEIRLGPVAIDGYISKLFGIRTDLQDGNRLVLKPALRKELTTSGHLTFAPVVIAEPSRFSEYKADMLTWINEDGRRVPTKYTSLFTIWSALSKAVKNGIGYKLTVDGEELDLTAEQVKTKLSLLCNSVIPKNVL